MKGLSKLVGLAALLVGAWAVVGRFHGPPTVSAFNQSFAASSLLAVANLLLLLAVFLNLCSKEK